MAKKTRAEVLAQTHKLLVRAMLPTSAADNEALSAYEKYRKLVATHGFKLDELRPPEGASKAWTLEDFLRAGDKVKDVVAAVKAAAADPETQKTIAAVRDIGSAVAKGWGALKKARGR